MILRKFCVSYVRAVRGDLCLLSLSWGIGQNLYTELPYPTSGLAGQHESEVFWGSPADYYWFVYYLMIVFYWSQCHQNPIEGQDCLMQKANSVVTQKSQIS